MIGTLRLPMPHFTVADAWTALPPSTREGARDYLRADRLTRRFVRDRSLIGYVEGYRAARVPVAEARADGYLASCSCERRQPCAHVGALVMAYAEAPDAFLRFLAVPADGTWTLWAWARGMPFPWELMADRVKESETLELHRLLRQVPAEARSARLREWVLAVPPDRIAGDTGWRELEEALADIAHQPLAAGELSAWLGLLGLQPRLPLAPLLDAVPPPSVEPRLRAYLANLEADRMEAPRPSQLLAGRTVLGLLADWLERAGRGVEVPGVFSSHRFLDPASIHLGDWLFAHGRFEAARAVWQKAAPTTVTQRRALEARLTLAAGEAVPLDPDWL